MVQPRAPGAASAPPSPAILESVTVDRFEADGDDLNTAAALIVDDTTKSDDPKAPHDNATTQDATPPSPAMSASVAGDRSQPDGNDIDTEEKLLIMPAGDQIDDDLRALSGKLLKMLRAHASPEAHLLTDDAHTAAAPIVDDAAKSDDPNAPHDSAAAQDAAPPRPAMSASVADDRSQADGDDTDTTAALIADDTTKSDNPQVPATQSARDDAAGAHALGDAVMVVAGGGRRSHEGIVRFVGTTRFAPRVWGWRAAL